MTVSEQQHREAKQQITGIFDRAAPTYDQVGARFFAHFGRRLVEVAGLASGSAVLDVATGRGAVLFPAAEAVGSAGRVVGIDLAQHMLAATQAEATARGVTNVALQHMDAEALQFPDATFDAALCGFALFLLPQMDHALAQIRRVLCPGGRITVSTWVNVFGPEFAWLQPLQTQFAPTMQAPARTGDGAAPVFDTPEGLSAILSNAGFTDVMIVADTAQFSYADEEAWWASLWSHGMRGWLEAVEQHQGAATLQRFKDAAFMQLHTQRTPDGFVQTSSVLFGSATKPTN